MNSVSREAAKVLPAGSTEHYSAFIGPPDQYDTMGATQFRLACSLGLREHHKLLDFGCGSLRAGRFFITYLESGNYCGIDPNQWLVDEAIANELSPDLVEKKKCRFANNDDFDCSSFNEKFDFIFAQSIFSHAGRGQVKTALKNFGKNLSSDGIIAATFIIAIDPNLDHKGNEWFYPGCVSYSRQSIRLFAEEANLSFREIPWYHPRQTWFLFTQTDEILPDQPFIDNHLSGLSYRNQPIA